MLAPFEPLDTASLEAVSYKTFVLIALALGARRGKLCALRRGQFVCPAEDWSFVLLYSLPPGNPPRDDATVLCPVSPVRALKAYMAGSAFINNRETLFLPLDCTLSLSHYCLSKFFC